MESAAIAHVTRYQHAGGVHDGEHASAASAHLRPSIFPPVCFTVIFTAIPVALSLLGQANNIDLLIDPPVTVGIPVLLIIHAWCLYLWGLHKVEKNLNRFHDPDALLRDFNKAAAVYAGPFLFPFGPFVVATSQVLYGEHYLYSRHGHCALHFADITGLHVKDRGDESTVDLRLCCSDHEGNQYQLCERPILMKPKRSSTSDSRAP